MPTACVLQPNCRIRLASERLEIWGPGPSSGPEEILREIPIRDVDRVILAESVQISSAAMAALLRAEVPVNYLGWNGQFLGGFLPAGTAHGLSRLSQYQRSLDAGFTLSMAGRIITAKIYNQRRVLQRLAASRQPAAPPGQTSVGQTSGLPVAGASGSPACQPGEPSGPGLQSKPEPADRRSAPQPGLVQSVLGWLDALFASITWMRFDCAPERPRQRAERRKAMRTGLGIKWANGKWGHGTWESAWRPDRSEFVEISGIRVT